ncbi:hypothetical protein [Sapientia aquatica]|uniref:Lipoprotein n=1 Tax=Sapientia aquatica TaxID=1549640 RepID=A0A4R5W0Y0_9BURK|nr:hypothetical protein [Sapientia aquatica]TDK65706.1 hypothetical protein E2I14_12280 [Sapientia aquatica]
MKFYRTFSRVTFLAGLTLFALTACDNYFVQKPSCGFGFDMGYDDQHAAVLDFLLMGENAKIAETQTAYVEKGHKWYFEGLGFQYDRPTSLYVKWQDDVSGSIYEKTVDLRPVIPRNLEATDLYFIVHGSEIFVYLKLNKSRAKDKPIIGSSIYEGYENLQLYPNSDSRK